MTATVLLYGYGNPGRLDDGLDPALAREVADVTGAGGEGWTSGAEVKGFAATRATDAEERNWRVLDPRRLDGNDEEGEDEA